MMKDKLIMNEYFDITGADEASDALGYDPNAQPTLEEQGWEYVASKEVKDDGDFLDVYYWYKNPKTGKHRFYFSSDVGYGDPNYFDWEEDSEKTAREWFDSYSLEDEEEDSNIGLDEAKEEKQPTLTDLINSADFHTILTDDARTFDLHQWQKDMQLDDEETDEILEEDNSNIPNGKFTVSKDDVQAVLDKIANNGVYIAGYRKTKGFQKATDLTDDDVKELARKLTTSDYSYSMKSTSFKLGDVISVFITDKDFVINGKDLSGHVLYIEIDADFGDIVALISIHDEYKSNKDLPKKNPYRNKEENKGEDMNESLSFDQVQEIKKYCSQYDSRCGVVDRNSGDFYMTTPYGMVKQNYFELKKEHPERFENTTIDEAVEDNLTAKAEIDTPRGTFYAYKGTWKDFENEPDRNDWGFWFDHYTDDDKHYRVMHNSKDQSAIAVETTRWERDRLPRESLAENKKAIKENADGKDELDMYINNDEPSYRILQGIVERGIEKGRSKDVVTSLVARKIGEMKDDFNQYGKIYTTAAERFEIAKDFVDSLWEEKPINEDKERSVFSKEEINVLKKNPFHSIMKGKYAAVYYSEEKKEDGTIAEASFILGIKKGDDWDVVEFKGGEDMNEYIRNLEKDESLNEDTVKQGSSWVNRGKEGTHGKFKTKKEADAQRRAIWLNWDK